MNNLKGLVLSCTLMCVLSLATFAGETPTPPCAPGETHTPPCSSQPLNDDPAAPGETQGPPTESAAVDVTDIAETMLWALLLF